MSSNWWLNRVGTTAQATTPTGASIPNYPVAVDVGAGPWQNARTFDNFVQDQAATNQQTKLDALNAAKQQQQQQVVNLKSVNPFMRGLGRLIGSPIHAIGQFFRPSTHGLGGTDGTAFGIPGKSQDIASGQYAQSERQGLEHIQQFGQLPGLKQANEAFTTALRPLETPLILDTDISTADHKSGVNPMFDIKSYLSGSNWAKAWRASDSRDPGQVVMDELAAGDSNVTPNDLDRIRQTSALYGLGSFAADLYIPMKFHPVIPLAKGLGEIGTIRRGILPNGFTSAKVAAAARNTFVTGDKYTGFSIPKRYGSWRGAQVAKRLPTVRNYIQTHDLGDVMNMAMFKQNMSEGGPHVAAAMKLAANDDDMWDLTVRAASTDATAWQQIDALKTSTPEDLAQFSDADAATYIDALESVKGRFRTLSQENDDLANYIDSVSSDDSKQPFPSYIEELHSDLADRQARLAEMQTTLERHKDYGDWLDQLPSVYTNPETGMTDAQGIFRLRQVSDKPANLSTLTSKTYVGTNNISGVAHTVKEVSKASWFRQASPIDLHRVSTGVESINRQFEQFKHLFGYVNRPAYVDILDRFTRAKTPLERYQIAHEVENHLVAGAAEHFGLEPDTVQSFLGEARTRRNTMTNALLSGKGTMYDTSPNSQYQLLSDDGEQATVRFMDDANNLTEVKVPSMALEPQPDPLNLPQDPTQTPNNYLPMNTREVYLAIKRNEALFARMDSTTRHFGRAATAESMKLINHYGTQFNGLWKPLQLIRIAWPERMLMDEGFRGLATLGLHNWVSSYGSATAAAATNTALAPLAWWMRRRDVRIGPGVISDSMSGRTPLTPDAAEVADAAPVVPERHFPVPSKQRETALDDHLLNAQEYIATKNRVAALRAENPNGSETADDLEALNVKPEQLPWHKPIQTWLKRKDFRNGLHLDPITGRRVGSGWTVPVNETPVSDLSPETVSSFLMQNRDLMNKQGYRLSIRKDGDGFKLQTVRHFRAGDRSQAIDLAHYTHANYILDHSKAEPETYLRDWSDRSPIEEYNNFRLFNNQATDASDVVPDGSRAPRPVNGFTTLDSPEGEPTAIRNARTGRSERMLDTDEPLTADDREALRNAGLPQAANAKNWTSLLRGADRDAITKFLAEKRGVGVLKRSHGRQTMYSWLHPDDTEVAPPWASGRRYITLSQMMEHPDSTATIVPESRIIRSGATPRAAVRTAEQQATDLAAAANGDLRAQERAFEDASGLSMKDIDTWMDNSHDSFLRKLLRRREAGHGYRSFVTADNKRVTAEAALEGRGGMYGNLASSTPMYAQLRGNYNNTLQMLKKVAMGYKRMKPPDMSMEELSTFPGRRAAKEYLGEWADMLNNFVRQSPIWYKMLEGQQDDQIVNWLRNTAEGAKIRRELPYKGNNPEKWVADHRSALDYYLPSNRLQSQLHDAPITPSMLRRHISTEDLPDIFAKDLTELNGQSPHAQWVKRFTDAAFRKLSSQPTDVLSRQPFFVGMYNMEMRNLVAATKGENITNEALAVYEKSAREFALNQTKTVMFDLMDESNFTQAIRFLSPFWGAQEEAIVKWANIVVQHPDVMARFFIAQHQVYNHLTVINTQGQIVHNPGAAGYNPNDRVVLQIPKFFDKVPFFGKALRLYGGAGLNIGSLNTALQGNQPILPSLGPMVTMPANQLMNWMWDDQGTRFSNNDIYKWVFPVGRPDRGVLGDFQQLIPGWSKRIQAIGEGQDNRTYQDMYFSNLREMTLDNKQRGLPPPTPTQVAGATKDMLLLSTLASFALPSTLQFMPRHQYLLDAYHRMLTLYGPNKAFDKFATKYGQDAIHYAASSSTTIGGVPPSVLGMTEYEANKNLIAKYPGWGGAIISPAAFTAPFSSDVYNAQFHMNLPGTNQKLRTSEDAPTRADQTDVKYGWLVYQKFMANIDATLTARGLTSTTQSAASDLADMKRTFVSQLMTKNPAWAAAYNNSNENIYQEVGQLQKFAFDKRFDTRPDFQGVRQYLTLRNATAEQLDAIAANGGSRNLQAESNTQLRNWYYMQVGGLVQSNPMFADFYNRYLMQDTLTKGTGP